MAMRPADGRNPDKTKLQAQTSKEKVALAQAAQIDGWRRLVAAKGRVIDKALDEGNKRAKKFAEMMKRKEDTKKTGEDLGDFFHGMLKEAKTFSEIPVKEKLPEPPKNTIAVGSILPFLVAFSVWWLAVKKKVK